MSIAEFFAYLMGHGPTRELGTGLALVYVTHPVQLRPRRVQGRGT